MTTPKFKEEIQARIIRAYELDPAAIQSWDITSYRMYADALGYPAWLINLHFPMGKI